MRLVRIYLVATILAAALPTTIGLAAWIITVGDVTAFELGAAIAYPSAHVIYLGLPTFLLLHHLDLVRWWSLPAVGFALATIPLGLLDVPVQGTPYRVLAAGLLGFAGGAVAWMMIHYAGDED